MTDLLLDALATGWPIALTCASVVAVERCRAIRRRRRLNGALHELRRPLQALALGAARQAHHERAIAALGDLDREINGGAPAPRVPVAARRLVEEAIERWRPVAARRGRRLEVGWKANGTRLFCRPGAIAAALDGDDRGAGERDRPAGRDRVKQQIRHRARGRRSGGSRPPSS